MARSVSLLVLLACLGCASDAQKLERLEQDAAIMCLRADVAERDNKSAAEISRARAECTLANRELNRFLNR